MQKLIPQPQQEIMREFLLSHDIAALFVDMGLGKTASVLSALDHLFTDCSSRGALVVSPLRVSLLTWPNEIKKWFPWMKIANLRTKEGLKAWQDGSAQIYLINYEMLQAFCSKHIETGRSFSVDTVIWDEISKAKAHNSKRINAFRPYRKYFKRHWGLTGTPISNSYMDLFAPIRLLDGGERLGKGITAFKERYFDSDYMGWNWTLKPWAKNALHEKIADITLTLKASEYLDIPPMVYQDIEVSLPPDTFKQYKKLEKDSLIELEKSEIVGINAAALVGKLLQFTSGAIYDEDREVQHIHKHKMAALVELFVRLKKDKKNLLVATQFIHERERILEHFSGYAEVFDGSNLDRWNAGKIPMLIADPRSIGHGINAQEGGHHLCWFTPTYSRELYDQTNARLARMGQTFPTIIYRLLCSGTGDWAVVEALRTKGDEQTGLKAALQGLQTLGKA
jgi:SNF2 family DNA or RNA helicase